MKLLRRTLFIRWGAPLVVTALIFSLAQPSFAQMLEADATLAQFVAANDVAVGSEVGSNGFRQIYYDLNGDKTFITDSNYTNADPVTDREYIAWMGQVDGSWSIFLYHIPTGTTTELSNPSNNVNPRLSRGKVVWEGWVEARWQVFLFDGTSVRQVTQGDLSLNPDIEGDDIIYARKNAQGEWSAFRHSLGTDEIVIIKQGRAAKKPVFINGVLVFPIEKDIEREAARRQAEEEARRLAEEAEKEARLAEETVRALEASSSVEAPLEESAPEESVEPGESTTTETVAEEPVLPAEPTEPETVTEEEIIAELEGEPQEPAQDETTDEVTEEEPVLSEELTEPETVTEEEIIAELEGEPLVEEPAPAPEPIPAPEPTPEPELPPPASPPPAPEPEPSPPPEA